MDKDKWKTQPCKECILKGKCSKHCFDFPSSREPIENHIESTGVVDTCLSCGSSINRDTLKSHPNRYMKGCRYVCRVCTKYGL